MNEEDFNPTQRTNGGAIGPAGPQCDPGPPGTPGPPGEFPLDEATLGLLADFARQAARLEGMLEGQRSGALSLFARQRGLQGNWMLSGDGRSLVRAPAAPAQ